MDKEHISVDTKLIEKVVKDDIPKDLLKLTTETLNTRYPSECWLHTYTNGSQIEGYENA